MANHELRQYNTPDQPRGLEGVTEVLSTQGAFHITDLDDTVKEPKEVPWADGISRQIYPQTVAAFMAEHAAGVKIGAITDQSFKQMEPWLNSVAQLALGEGASAYDLFNGPMIGETGTVLRYESGQRIVLATPQAMKDQVKLFEWFMENIKKQNPSDTWGQLDGIDTMTGVPVQLANLGNEASLTLWEQGPHVSANPEFIQRYGLIRQRIARAMSELGIHSLETFEAGNGSLRILPEGISKATTLARLANEEVIDPTDTCYTGDGYNDVEAAKQVRRMGGVVAAVSNAVPELYNVADYHTRNHSGLGIAEVVSQALPAQYGKALADLQHRGLL